MFSHTGLLVRKLSLKAEIAQRDEEQQRVFVI